MTVAWSEPAPPPIRESAQTHALTHYLFILPVDEPSWISVDTVILKTIPDQVCGPDTSTDQVEPCHFVTSDQVHKPLSHYYYIFNLSDTNG